MKSHRRKAKKAPTEKTKEKKEHRLGGTKQMAERWSRSVGVGKGL